MSFPDSLNVNPNVLRVAAASLLVMSLATLIRRLSIQTRHSSSAEARMDSLRTWWAVVSVILLCALGGPSVSVVVFLLISAAALREFFNLTRLDPAGASFLTALIAVALSYLWIWMGLGLWFITFLPAFALLWKLIGMAYRKVQNDPLKPFVQAPEWGLVVAGYTPAYAVLLMTAPPAENGIAGAAGWFLFLLFITELNDIGQALSGRALGHHRIAPELSPGKTWEGFAGGLLLTAIFSAVLGQWLTPASWLWSMTAGLIIGVSGFFGDLNVSALKRACRAKDSSQILPGQGGILDRIDSLSLSAPVFYYFVRGTAHSDLSGWLRHLQ